MEIFKTIPNYEKYKVSNKGNVMSYAISKQGRLLKKQKESIGYLSVKLPKEIEGITKFYTILIHRLVAAAFIVNPENKRCINHIDCNKCNNNVENLEWCTYSENAIHAHKNGLVITAKGEKQGSSKLTENDVFKIKELSKTLSARKIAKLYNMDNTVISDILRGDLWKHLLSN
jgi:hypothetical protein